MATAVRRNRFVPDSVVVLAAVAGLLLGLAALCCCLGEHATHGAGRVAAASPAMAPATVSDLAMGGDPADQDAGRTDDGCRHPGEHAAAAVVPGGVATRGLPAVAAAGVHPPDPVEAPPAGTVAGMGARAPASHLLCIMRT